jgi:hypothetical protein
VGDFNGDGVPDLAVANSLSHNVSVLLGNGDGTFRAAQNYGAGTAPVFVAVGDFNGVCAEMYACNTLLPDSSGCPRYERDRFLDECYSLFGSLDHFVRRKAQNKTLQARLIYRHRNVILIVINRTKKPA